MVVALSRAGARDDRVLLLPLDVPAVKAVLEAGGDPNYRAQDGRTPLWCAVHGGREDVARILLKRGARINERHDIQFSAPRRRERGRTVLMDAAAAGPPSVVELLLEAGADPNQADEAGTTALMLVPERGTLFGAFKSRTKIAQLLLKAGADPTRRRSNGNTAAEIANARGDQDLARLLNLGAAHARRGATKRDPRGSQ